MRRTLIVTNDFPPRQGGIQSFVHELALRLDPADLTVYAPKWDGAPEFDARQPFEVVRHPTSLMIGGPSVTRRAAELAQVAAGRGRHLRRRRAARADHPRAAPRRGAEGDRDHPRARGRLGRAPGRQKPAPPHRRADRRRHLPGRVLPGPAGPGAHPRRGGAADPAPPRRRRDRLQARPGRPRGDQGTVRPGRPPGRGLRLPPGPPQGPGHPAASLAGGHQAGPRRGPAHRRRGSVRASPQEFGRTDRAYPLGPLHRPGPAGGAPRALRRGRRLLDALPHQARRPRRRGPRHRLPRGLRRRPAGSGRRLRRRPRRDPGRRNRLRGRRPGGSGPVGAPGRPAVQPGGRQGDGRKGPRLGRARLVLGPDRHPPPHPHRPPNAPVPRPAPAPPQLPASQPPSAPVAKLRNLCGRGKHESKFALWRDVRSSAPASAAVRATSRARRSRRRTPWRGRSA